MENFHKNWLVILLVAVVFGTLGFLLGRTTAHSSKEERMVFKYDQHPLDAKDSIDVKVEVQNIDDAFEITEKTDTVMKDGKQIIIKEVKKIKKQG